MSKHKLDLQNTGTFQTAAQTSLLTVCPSMELISYGTTNNQIGINRYNGQKVYLSGQKVRGTALEIRALAWKSNGRLLATAWSDAHIRILDPESGKIIQKLDVGDPNMKELDERGDVTCIAWTTNICSKASTARDGAVGKTQSVWKQILEEERAQWKNGGEGAVELDLPRDLTLLDVESCLPKLSTLPSGADEVFTSPSSLATLFRPLDAESSSNIDVLLIGLGTGSIHITISSSFTIGTFGIPSLQSKTAIHTLTSHTSHPSFSVHGLLMRSSSKLVSGLSFVPIDLSFLDTSSEYLGLLASKATALQNLLRYLSETQKVLVTEFTTGRELPGRYLSNLQDLFEERGSSWTVVPALYHQVLTGHSIPEVREWLSEIADRGHKRWSKAVLSSFTSLRSLIHRKLIPTLTRIAAICSRLHGLALYHTPPSSSSKPCILGFSAQQIKGILDTVAGLTLVAEHMLTLVVEDLDNWGTFEEWLGYEVAHAITDKKPTEEELEKESSINHSKVLSYIQSSLVSHNLDPFLREVEKDEAESYFAYDEAEPMFETLTTELRALDTTEKKPAPSPLPNLRVLIDRLQRLSSAVFDGIASTQARGVHIGKPITISEGKTRGPCYIRMMPSPSASETVSLAPSSKDGSDETMTDQYPDPSADGDPEEGVSHTYIAQIGGDRESIQLHLIKLRTENGLTKQISKQIGLFYLGLGIVDIAFYSDDYIIVLYTNLKRVGSHLERSMIPSPPNAKKNGKRDDDEERFFLALVPYREGKLLAGYREVGKGFKPYEGEGEARGLSRRATDVVSEAGNWEITGCGVDGDEPGGGGGDEEWIPERVVVREPGVVVVLGGGGGGRYGVYRVTESGVQTA